MAKLFKAEYKGAKEEASKAVVADPMQHLDPMQPSDFAFGHSKGGDYSQNDIFNSDPTHVAKYECTACSKSKMGFGPKYTSKLLQCACGTTRYCGVVCQVSLNRLTLFLLFQCMLSVAL